MVGWFIYLLDVCSCIKPFAICSAKCRIILADVKPHRVLRALHLYSRKYGRSQTSFLHDAFFRVKPQIIRISYETYRTGGSDQWHKIGININLNKYRGLLKGHVSKKSLVCMWFTVNRLIQKNWITVSLLAIYTFKSNTKWTQVTCIIFKVQ